MQFDPSTIEWKTTRYPGISLCWLYQQLDADGAPKPGSDAVVLIRMEGGCGYPRHRHLGEERVLVLDGGFADEAGEYRVNQWVIKPPGSVHTPVALPGTPCILLATAYQGIELID